jgi:drug/metabolite transporter (DMT)-like permease
MQVATASSEKLNQNTILYLLVVVIWGGSWIAIKYQIGVVPAEFSVAYRFGIAAILMFAWVIMTGRQLRFPASDYARFAAAGLFMFSSNFLFFYHSAAYLVSGLMALTFSMVSIFNLINGFLFRGERAGGRIWFGAVLGVSGLAAIFLPGIESAGFGPDPVRGILFAIAGTLSFSFGNTITAGYRERDIPVFSSNAYSMLFGTFAVLAVGFMLGETMTFDFSAGYMVSLLGLAVFSTVIVFGAYVTLVRNIGAARAGYTTVVFPVVALGLSTIFEGFQWTLWGAGGLALIVAGNIIVMRR